jgi:hypothetical protein
MADDTAAPPPPETTVAAPPPPETLVKAYIKLRDAIADAEEAHKAKMEAYKQQFDTLASSLLAICNAINADSIRTPYGTISRKVTTRYWTNDWDSMRKFIKEHDALDLLEQRIHNGNMRQFLDENPDLLPMGLQVDSRYGVQVRRASPRKSGDDE